MSRRSRTACAVVVLGGLLAGCSGKPAADRVEQRNMAVVRGAHAALARGDFESFRAAIGPNYVRHCQAMPPGLQELRGTDEFFAFLQEFLAAVPEYDDTLSQMIADGDRVAYVSTMSGTQIGPMGDLPASGRDFVLKNIVIQRIEDGKVAETWISWDNVAMLTQLGFFPPSSLDKP